MTRWGLVPVQEPSALIARIRKRLDVVVGAIASTADPEERWEPLQALQRSDAAVEAVLVATPPEGRRMLDAVASTPRSARSHSAENLVVAVVEAHGPDGDRAAGVASVGACQIPEGAGPPEAGASARPAGETATEGGTGGVDEEARLVAEMTRLAAE